MSTNGFIILYDPTAQFGNPNTGQSFPCMTCQWDFTGDRTGGTPQERSNFSYMIAPLLSNFEHDESIAGSGFFYETDDGGTWFEWRKVVEPGTTGHNTFGVQLWPDGSFDYQYADINISQHDAWIGFAGDANSKGDDGIYNEVNELFYKAAPGNSRIGGMTMEHVTGFASNETDFGYAWYGEDGGYQSVVSIDCSNPLNDASCEGYEQAYTDQQCSADALYDTQCPGYQQAYTDQQCGLDALYDTQCPGYQQAFTDQQCESDALYDPSCPGFTEANFDKECSEDALHDSQCTGYGEAWLDQECETDPMFSQSCPGYQIAKQQEELANMGSPDPFFKDDKPDDGSTGGYEDDPAGGFVDDAILFIDEPVEKFMEEPVEKFMEEPVFEPVPVAEVKQERPRGEEPDTEPEPIAAELLIQREPEPEPVVVSVERIEKGIFVPVEDEVGVEAEMVLKIETPVEKVAAEKAVVVEPTPVKELNVSKQSSVQIALSVVEEERQSANERLSQSITNSQTQQDSFSVTGEEQQTEINDTITSYTSSAYQNDTSVNNTEGQVNDPSQISDADGVVIEDTTMSVASDTNSDQGNVVFDVVQEPTMSAAGEQQDDTVVEVEQESFSTTDQMFDTQVNEAFSTGANISVVLSGARPDFSKFDVKPPTKQQAVDTAKVESLADKMSTTALNQNIEQLQQQVQESGGFEDQTVAVTLINYTPGFYESSTQSLNNQNDWYGSESIYKSNGNVDNNMTMYKMAGQTGNKHKQMVLEQYRR